MTHLAGALIKDGPALGAALAGAMLSRAFEPSEKTVHVIDCALLASASTRLGEAAFAQVGHATICFDGRLGDRDALALRLDVSRPCFEGDDAELLLLSYHRWGKDCLHHLTGEFAFAIWDQSEQILFCARDRFGVKPFFYSDNGQHFLFSSEISSLLASGLVEGSLDAENIADLLAGWAPSLTASPYSAIRQLPPAHWCIVSRTDLRVVQYWQLPIPDEYRRDDAAEQFRSILEHAVAERLPANGRFGSALSGGLDSSSITQIAARQARERFGDSGRSFTLVYDNSPSHNERPFAEAVVQSSGVRASYIAADEFSPFDNDVLLLDRLGGPFWAPNLSSTFQLHGAAASAGVTILLDGHGGDETVSSGLGLLTELAKAHRWMRLWHEVRHFAQTEQLPALPMFASLVRSFLVPRQLNALAARGKQVLSKRAIAGSDGLPLNINRDFATRTGLLERHQMPVWRGIGSTYEDRVIHYRSLTGDLQSYALSLLTRTARVAGVDLRFPLWDQRLVEFCLSLPANEKLSDGWTRMVMRKAMGDLPASVRWRKNKLDFSTHLLRTMSSNNFELIEHILNDRRDTIAEYVDLGAVDKAWAKIRSASATGLDVHAVWRTVLLGRWLECRTREQF